MDWKNPDYTPIFMERMERLQRIRADPSVLPALRAYYREHPADFIDDWGSTYEFRNPERGLPAVVPFRLFPRQRKWVEWVVDSWKNQRPGVTEKSRDAGVSWVSIALAVTLCLHRDGIHIGMGSRAEKYVDELGSPKALFVRARQFIEMLPPEFRNGFNLKTDAPFMRLNFRATGSTMGGEVGDNIGRGDRASIYFVDESAHLERPDLIERSLSATTNCRIDISSANGMTNPFATKVHTWPRERVFRFHWRDDPRKDDAWYAKQVDELDPVTVAQEIDINYSASVEGVLIPSVWINSAVRAAAKLGIEPTGAARCSLDVADEGVDLNALCGRLGISVALLEAWSGKGDDIFGTVQRAFGLCDEFGAENLDYDADGLGAGVRGDARVINETRSRPLKVEPWRGSGAVFQPDKQIPTAQPAAGRDTIERINKDFFKNAKAQAYWSLRLRFQRTHRCVMAGSIGEYDPDDLISLDVEGAALGHLIAELSQPTYTIAGDGKMIVDKAPKGQRSPNYADSVMIAFAPRKGAGWLAAYAR